MEMANHVLLLTDSIGQEGTGKFITHLANGLSANSNLKVSLLLLHTENQLFINDISSNVNIIYLDLKGRIRYSMPTIINKIIEIKPNICFVLYTQLVLLSYFSPLVRRKGITMVFRETIIPSMYRGESNFVGKLFVRFAYKLYDHIVAQSKDMYDDLVNNWNCNKQKVTVINNPVSLEKIKTKIQGVLPPLEFKQRDKPIYVSAGRLTKQKGYDIILQRLSEMETIPFRYYILGEGEERFALEKIIKEKHLENDVILLGFKENPYEYIYYSDALILSSRYEGFPNIVLEANAIGKPVLSNMCPGGINEIIKEGVNGVACNFENPKDFEEGLVKFMSTSFVSDTIKSVTVSRYGFQEIMNRYYNFINELVTSNGRICHHN